MCAPRCGMVQAARQLEDEEGYRRTMVGDVELLQNEGLAQRPALVQVASDPAANTSHTTEGWTAALCMPCCRRQASATTPLPPCRQSLPPTQPCTYIPLTRPPAMAWCTRPTRRTRAETRPCRECEATPVEFGVKASSVRGQLQPAVRLVAAHPSHAHQLPRCPSYTWAVP